jgi:hypothetical protein
LPLDKTAFSEQFLAAGEHSVFGVMRIALIAVLGFLLAAAQTTFAADTAEKTISRTYDVQPGGDLNVEVERGDVHVTTGNQNKVTVVVEREVPGVPEDRVESALKKHRVRITQEGTSVRVESGEKPRALSFHKPQEVTVHVRITVPKVFNVSLATTGSIELSGLHGSADVRSSGGDLNIANVEGVVDAHTAGGNIRAAGCTDQLTVQTSGGTIVLTNFTGPSATLDSLGGDIEVADCEGRLQAKTSGGDIWLNNFIGVGVYAETSGGTILFELAKKPEIPCSLRTAGGNIIVRLAPDVAINVNATTDGGSARTAIPIDATVKERTSPGHLEGKINGGGPSIMLKTVGGNIEILKR